MRRVRVDEENFSPEGIMYRTYENSPKMPGARTAILRWVLGLVLGTVAINGWAAPANDNFGQAAIYDPTVRQVSGKTVNNVGATKEIGEPNHAGNAGGASVWWSWVAPISGPVEFDTQGSTFDTLLAVYTGTDVTSLAPLSANDDVNFPADKTSKITFIATAGTTYMIAVDGYGGATGSIFLNWSPIGALAGGNFLFAAGQSTADGIPLYQISEYENSSASIADPNNSPAMGSALTRLVVKRASGSAGYLHATVLITNSTYTNLVWTNQYGTNIYTTNIDNTTPTPTITYTNAFTTNQVDVLWQQYYYPGFGYQYLHITNGTIFTNTFTAGTWQYPPPLIPPGLVVGTNIGAPPIPCAYVLGKPVTNATAVTVGATTVTNYLITVTESYCTNILTDVVVPSAIAGLDYTPAVFDVNFYDYQQSAEITGIGIRPSFLKPPRLVLALITNVSLDSAEISDIVPPTIDPVGGAAFINVVSLSGRPLDPNNDPEGPGGTTNSIVNFVATNHRYSEGNSARNLASVGVVWLGSQPGGSVSYTINSLDIIGFSIDTFALQAGSDFATPSVGLQRPSGQSVDVTNIQGTITYKPFPNPQYIEIPVPVDNLVEFNEDFQVNLYNANGCLIGQNPTATVTILDRNLPAGTADLTFNVDASPLTDPPYNAHPGPNGEVHAVAVQSDDKILLAGDFNAFNTKPRGHIARVLAATGQIDEGFMAFPNSGSDGIINALALQGDGKILIGGQFTSFNGSNLFSIGRLTSSGGVDGSFNPGLGVQTIGGVPGNVLAMALQPDGKILVVGDFNRVGGTNRINIARFNADGSVDSTFDSGVGPNGIINCLALQRDNRIVVAGQFTTFDNVSRAYIARLMPDGSLDNSFDPGTGANDAIYAIAVQPDTRIVVGGAFTSLELNNFPHIGRLNSDGSLDTTFLPGAGLDANVYAITLESSGKIFLAGNFESYNSTRRMGLARLLTDGKLDTSFLDTAYNEFAGLLRHYNSEDVEPRGALYSVGLQSTGDVIIGGNFSKLGGSPGAYSGKETSGHLVIVARQNFARLIGGGTPGPGNIGFANSSYSADKAGATSFITLVRTNGSLGQASVSINTTAPASGNGAAVQGVDYTLLPKYQNPTWISSGPTYGGGITWMDSDAVFGPNNTVISDITQQIYQSAAAQVFITLLNPPGQSGNRSLDLAVNLPAIPNFVDLGGEPMPTGVALGLTYAPLTIVDNTTPHGVLGFSSALYTVDQNGTNAVITVVRTNGSSGVVQINYATANGVDNLPFTVGARAGSTNDYLATSGKLTFGDGITNQTFRIPLINNGIVKPDATIQVYLFNVTGGGVPGLTNTIVKVINDNLVYGKINFTATNYTVRETETAAVITATRTGGSAGTVQVTYSASSGAGATAGVDFTAVTNTLLWNSGDVAPKTFTVPVFHDNQVLTNLKTVNLKLYGAIVNTAPQKNALGTVTNATLSIRNDDQFGHPTFSVANYYVNENAGFANITVLRQGGSAQTIAVDYFTSDFTAKVSNNDYQPVHGTLTFGPGVFSQNFTVPITEHAQAGDAPAGIYSFLVNLTNPVPASGPGGGVTLGSVSTAVVNIIDNYTYNQPPGGNDPVFNPNAYFNGTVYSLVLQPDGKILAGGDFTVANAYVRNHIARLNQDGSLDVKFSSETEGTDGVVRSILRQSDGGIVIAGGFQQVSSVNRSKISRLNLDGSLDTTFNPGSGFDNTVYSLAETFSGTGTNATRKLVVGGAFTLANGFVLHGIAQLNNNGTIDQGFVATGANAPVYGVAVYSTNDFNSGKIIIVGDFTMVNGTARNHIARLNADGTLDTTFDPGVGPDQPLRAVAIQVDGKLLIGGLFTSIGGVPASHLARLNSDGSIDASFAAQPGTSDSVLTLALQEDLKIIVGGAFTSANGVTRGRITRLNPDGTVDGTINFGSGANDFVSSVVIQSDEKMILGGGFTTYDGVSHPYIARIYGLTEQDAGAVTFTTAGFSAIESTTNGVITVRRTGGTTGAVQVDVATSDGTAIAGQDYVAVSKTLTFPSGETFESFNVPLLDTLKVGPNLTINLTLSNPRGGNSFNNLVLGVQPTAVLTILNDNSTVSFSSPNYRIVKNNAQGSANIYLERSGSTIGQATVDFATTTTGTAIPGIDFTPVASTVVFSPGQTEVVVTVPVINNGLVEGNTTVGLAIMNASNTVPSVPSTSLLTIVDNNLSPGNLSFAGTNYIVYENPATNSNATNAVAAIKILRTGGTLGQVSVQIGVSGGTALPGVDYIATNQTLAFADGQTENTFYVTIPHNPRVTGNQYVNIGLSNPTGGALILGPSSEQLIIVDQDVGFGFVQPSYFVSETAGSLSVSVQRLGRTNGTYSVTYATMDGTALAGTAYGPLSNILTFASGETLKTFTLPIYHNTNVTGNQSFTINLSNPSPLTQLGAVSTALVTVLDVDTGLAFATNQVSVVKSAGQIAIGVVRTGSPAGSVGIAYSTSDGSATAGVKYTSTTGVLTFLDGQTSNYFTVPILNDNAVDGDQTFNVTLSNPSNGAQLLAPSVTTVTIVDITSGFNFANSVFSVNENGVSALITVLRNGVTNTAVSVNYATTDGSARAGVDYVATSGVLQFLPGQTSRTFPITIIDRGLIGGTVTALISLSNPSTNGILLATNIATLNINDNDGSLIVPAGVSLITESGPTNGVIDPGETVTVLFALRDGAGNSTSNLVATLLSTNGVTAPSAPQTYGALQAFGPSVSRPFTFTANGTNGGNITAVFSLQDGTNNLGSSRLVFFTFALGANTNTFSNNSTIVINDLAPASPYPATINVAGLNGLVSKVTVTVSNLSHGYLSDVDMLLVGPAGQKQLLMTHIGGGHGATNLTLTFDDSAANSLTTSTPTNGTYKPTQFGIVPFPAPAPVQPYALNLATFNGTNPNGAWSLYVLDDNALDVGGITNGWSLKIQTVSPVPGSSDLVLGSVSTPVQVVATSNLVFTLNVTNAGPSPATGVVLSNTLPAGAAFVSSVPANQAVYNSGGTVTVVFNLGNLGTNGTTNVFITASAPASVGSITNFASVAGNESDPNLDNNVASSVSAVIPANADLAIGLVGAPDPVFAGGTLVYTMSVTNLGPASATNAIITDVLPAGMAFVSTSAGGSYTTNSNTITFNLGGLGSGTVVKPTITVRPTSFGIVTNTVSITSGVPDPFKGNNRASVKTIVQAVEIASGSSAGSVVFTWPASVSGYVIEFTPTLLAPVVWTTVTNPLPVIVNGQYKFTPNLPGYYRLRAPLP